MLRAANLQAWLMTPGTEFCLQLIPTLRHSRCFALARLGKMSLLRAPCVTTYAPRHPDEIVYAGHEE